jgi:hypothetical protein
MQRQGFGIAMELGGEEACKSIKMGDLFLIELKHGTSLLDYACQHAKLCMHDNEMDNGCEAVNPSQELPCTIQW